MSDTYNVEDLSAAAPLWNVQSRQTDGYSFTDRLGSFITNAKFNEGFSQCKAGRNNENTYIWSAVSAIGEDCSEVIYENVLNYINNVSNVDLSKVKALKSMIDVLGVKYSVLDNIDAVPLELLNMIDMLSINKKYLLDSKVFKKEFIDEVSTFCITTGDPGILSDELSASTLSGMQLSGEYVDEQKYRDFLVDQYDKTLSNFIFLKYAEAENGLNSKYSYIYEYMVDDLANSLNATHDDADLESEHDKEIRLLKLRYNVPLSFDNVGIVDDIDAGNDFLENYTAPEQAVLSAELARRADIHEQYTHQGNSRNDALAMKLARHSYYREKKVKEYFNYVEKQYSDLLMTDGLVNSVTTKDGAVNVYDVDPNYFTISQDYTSKLIKDGIVQLNVIHAVAKILAEQTLAIAEVREQLKVQMQKTYIRGTFLLLSYVINEYLKHNIAEVYSSKLNPINSEETLASIISASAASGENVKLIEYIDNTEYFNIETSTTPHAKNAGFANARYWDAESGQMDAANDLPLDEIERFYAKTLSKSKNITNVAEFLKAIYAYGANTAYIDKDTGDFTYQLSDFSYSDMSAALSDEASAKDYYEHKKVYLQYSGQPVGFDPVYNYKNKTHSSYQIHPYLFNFVEKSNFVYPVANLFYNAISEGYEQQLVADKIDSVIGKCGQTLDAWKTNSYDYSGYMSRYEASTHFSSGNSSKLNPTASYDGLFYEPALAQYINNPQAFINAVKTNSTASYYYTLNLSNEDLLKVVNQLTQYYSAINEVATGGYDIFKYAIDAYGNSIILIKRYGTGVDVKDPSTYARRRSTPGEIWIKAKDHPFAFPAFDYLSPETSWFDVQDPEFSQYFKQVYNTYNKINSGYIQSHYVGTTQQCTKVFYDFELDPTGRALVAALTYITGYDDANATQSASQPQFADSCRFYGNSELLVGVISQEYDYAAGVTKRYLSRDAVDSVDNITSPGLMMSDSQSTYSEFLGFMRYKNALNVVFLDKRCAGQKLIDDGSTYCLPITVKSYRYGGGITECPQLVIRGLKYQATAVTTPTTASNTLLADNGKKFSIAFAGQSIDSSQEQDVPTVGVVNNVSYGNFTSHGTTGLDGTAAYPAQAMQKSGKYSSADYFQSYVTTVDVGFTYAGLYAGETKYYNTNADIGCIPVYTNLSGSIDISKHETLKAKPCYGMEMLGWPFSEGVQIDSSEVEDLQENGRVVEEYRKYEIFHAYTKAMPATASTTTQLTVSLTAVDGLNISDTLLNDADLFKRYNLVIYNSNYKTNPLHKCPIADIYNKTINCSNYSNVDGHTDGMNLIGPNRGVSTSNIAGVNNVQVSINSTSKNLIITISKQATSFALPAGQFELVIYNNATQFNYDYYRLFENAYQSLPTKVPKGPSEAVSQQLRAGTDLSAIGFTGPSDSNKPFKNQNTLAKNARQMNAGLEFKYSEQDPVASEFPFVRKFDDSAVGTEQITFDPGVMYMFALDDHTTVDREILHIPKYVAGSAKYVTVDVNTQLDTYADFYDESLMISSYYVQEDEGNALYFNMSTYNTRPYIADYDISDQTKPPSYVQNAVDGTYLKLKPGESGRLDIRVEFRIYDMVAARRTLVGFTNKVLRSYYIINTSDDKPKFVISRLPLDQLS